MSRAPALRPGGRYEWSAFVVPRLTPQMRPFKARRRTTFQQTLTSDSRRILCVSHHRQLEVGHDPSRHSVVRRRSRTEFATGAPAKRGLRPRGRLFSRRVSDRTATPATWPGSRTRRRSISRHPMPTRCWRFAPTAWCTPRSASSDHGSGRGARGDPPLWGERRLKLDDEPDLSARRRPEAHRGTCRGLFGRCDHVVHQRLRSRLQRGCTSSCRHPICERVDPSVSRSSLTTARISDPSWATPYGFGQPEGAPAPILEPGVPTLFWGGMVDLLADYLESRSTAGGVLRKVVHARGIRRAHRTYRGRNSGGCSVRGDQESSVVCRRVFVEHVTRIRADAAPTWPCPPEGKSSVHRVEIVGLPSLTIDLTMNVDISEVRSITDPATDGDLGLIATAMRLVNAIPSVVAAPPGLVTALDLKLGSGRRLLGA